METGYYANPLNTKYRKAKSLKETFTFTVQNKVTGLFYVSTGSLESYIGASWQKRFQTSDELIADWNRQERTSNLFYFPCENLDFRFVN